MAQKRFEKLIYSLTFIFLVTATAVSAQTPLIEVQSMVDTSQIYIGDRITYSIIVNHDKNLRIEQPGEGLHLGMFEIKDYKFSDPVEENGIITRRYDFSISVFDTGHYTIPAYPLAYFPDSSNQYKIIEASPIDIYVKSILASDEAPELKDIKPPIDLPFDYMFLYSMLAILALIIFAAWLGFKAWKKKQEKGYIFAPPPKPRPAHEIALKALQKLYASDLLEKQEYKMFFSELSDILRTYLEGRYFISALEETTYEIIRDLKEHLDDDKKKVLSDILQLSDLVKFAKFKPEIKEIETVKIEAEQFIQDTKLIFSEEKENITEEKETPALTAVDEIK